MIAMHATDSFHPPAGIVVNNRPWSFFVIPVAAGVAVLVAFAFLWHNTTRRGSWPERWW
jgi:CBS-domain-containing membrane protein